MNELKELRIDSYESSRIYEAKIKTFHDKFFLKIHLPFFSSSEHVFQDFGGYKDGEKRRARGCSSAGKTFLHLFLEL